jgi:tetratricopeptide (TPR) repeat protein
MQLIATLLAGHGNTAPTRAITSVLRWVDVLLVLNSGLPFEHLNAIREQAGAKFRLVEFSWPHDFAAARNFAIAQATSLGGTWALTIDTDELIHFPGYSSQVELLASLQSNPQMQCWLVPFSGGRYVKERFVRLPTKLRWQGIVHEYLSGLNVGNSGVLPGAYFDEERKPPDRLANKLARDRRALEEQLTTAQRDSRTWFYLGMTLEAQAEHQQAIAAFLRCAEVSSWPEEVAWAAYKAASGLSYLGQFDRALTICIFHHRKKPCPELAWLAAYCSHRLQRNSTSLEWCRIAVADASDRAAAVAGHGSPFKFLPAWFEAPHDLMRQVFLALSMPKGARLAEDAFVTARRQRLAITAKFYPSEEAPAKRILFDLGAHLGEGLKRLSHELNLDESCEIHAFEPNPACRIRESVEWMRLPIEFHSSAAWTSVGEHDFLQEAPDISGSGSPTSGTGNLDGWGSCLSGIRTARLGFDSIIKVPTVDFAKILRRV